MMPLQLIVKHVSRYIDFGSSVDEILKGRTTRDYMRPGGLSERPDPPFSVDLNRKATIHHNFID